MAGRRRGHCGEDAAMSDRLAKKIKAQQAEGAEREPSASEFDPADPRGDGSGLGDAWEPSPNGKAAKTPAVRESFPAPIPAPQLRAIVGEDADWLLRGCLARGVITLL